MQRTDYDFDVISGPCSQLPAPDAIGLRRPADAALPAPPRRPAEEPAQRGDKG